MENSLVIRENDQQVTLQVDEIKKFIAPNATESEFWLFINTARSLNLNPIKRELYFVKYGEKASIITGYEVYIKRANQSKLLEWWKVKIEKPSSDYKTWIGIFTAKRKDWSEEFEWQVSMSECYKHSERPTPWTLMKEFMLKKTAIGQGMRLLIPEVLAGMPFLAEELGSMVVESDYTVIPDEDIIEPTDEELKAKEQERIEALETIQKRIDKCERVEKLDKLYTQEKLNTSELKTEIETMLADRRAVLLVSEWEAKVQKLSDLTGIKVPDIGSYVNDDIMDSEVVSEALDGNKDAIKQFGLDVNSFLQIKSESVDEPSVPESFIPEDAHNPE